MCSNVGRKNCHSLQVFSFIIVLLNCFVLSQTLSKSDLYPYGLNVSDRATVREDDGGSDKIILKNTFKYFSEKKATLFVNNNGILTFQDKLEEYKPRNFPLTENKSLIAPFWADVDTEHIGGDVWYRQTQDAALLSRATQEIRSYFIQQRRFDATWMLVVTWDNVGFFGASQVGRSKRNTFQAILVTDEVRSFAIFNYYQIQWTTGANSGGDLSTGLGGKAAQAGFNAGDRKNYYSIEGAQTPNVVNLTLTSNVGIPGKWVFQVDGASVQDIKCSEKNEITVQPSHASMLGGQEILVSGPCFSSDFNILARFRETNDTFKCTYDNHVQVKCVLPTVFRSGEMTLEINPYELGWNYTSVFQLTNVAWSVPKIVRVEPDSWVVKHVVTAQWISSLIPSNLVLFQVLAYNASPFPHFTTIQYSEINISSSSALSTHSFVLSDIPSNISSLILKVSWNSTKENDSHASSIWSDVFPVRWNTPEKSQSWCSGWLDKEKYQSNNTEISGSCPCTLRQAVRDTSRYTTDPMCSSFNTSPHLDCLYYSGASTCVRRAPSIDSTSGENCCYDNNGELTDVREQQDGGGLHTRYNIRAQESNVVPFFTYFEQDLLPYLHCCQYSTKKEMCQSFLEYRPPVTCQAYNPPTAAQGAGDPHLTSLDGKEYTFNGLGDFVLLEDTNSSIVIQVRAVQAKDTKGESQNASVFSAVAMTVKNVSDLVEVYTSENGAEIKVNGKAVSLETASSEFNGINIDQTRTDNSTMNYVVVLDSAGISVTLDVTNDLINVLVMIGNDQVKGKLRGLLGNYNGLESDDFISREGYMLPSNASLQEIHYEFGMTWNVHQQESLFLSPYPVSEDVLQSYEPVFLDKPDDGKQNQSLVVELCGNNAQCQFDYQVTGNERVARSTLKFIENFKELEEDIQKVIRCPFLLEPENGNKSVSGYQVGANATFWCNQRFVIVRGTTPRYCKKDGTWTGEHVECAEPIVINHSAPSQILTAVGIGTGTGGFLVILLLIGILLCRCKKLRKVKETDPEQQESSIEIPDLLMNTAISSSNIPNSVFENENFIYSLSSITGESGFKIPRPSFVDPEVLSDYFF